MKESIMVADLSHLSHQMVQAARDFVDLKFRIDTEGRKSPVNIPDDLHGRMSGGEFGPYFGEDFFTNIMPFLPRDCSSQKATVMAVPVAHTMGCSWRLWPAQDISMAEKESVIAYINSESGIQDTSYFYVPDLGLFFAGEGKNRVNFCRFHNIEHIPAQVYVKQYPAAEKIKVYVLGVAGGRDVWAVFDNWYVQKVSHYALALPLLRAYGVAVSHEWPKDLPALYVLLQNECYCSREGIFRRKVIDIRAVKTALAEQYVWHDLLDLIVSKKFIYLALLIAAAVLGDLAVSP